MLNFKEFLLTEAAQYQQLYWISPVGEIIGMNGGTHIDYVIKNPVAFNLTLDGIKTTFKNYKEPLNHEGYARDEILGNVLNQGWIRIRNNKNYWSAQGIMNREFYKRLKKWAWKMLDLGESPYSEVRTNKGTYSLQDLVKIDITHPNNMVGVLK